MIHYYQVDFVYTVGQGNSYVTLINFTYMYMYYSVIVCISIIVTHVIILSHCTVYTSMHACFAIYKLNMTVWQQVARFKL